MSLWQAGPSLALIKYWGKQQKGINIPAVSSLAVSLKGLYSRTEVEWAEQDSLELNGNPAPVEGLLPLLGEFRRLTGTKTGLRVRSRNTFPTAAGLASSSSAFASLAAALNELAGNPFSLPELSRLARFGSGSACRAVYGGFTRWPAGAEEAEPLAPEDHWPELRVLVVRLEERPKALSSRKGMNCSRSTSPFYGAWVENAEPWFRQASQALLQRDLEQLGGLMRRSYLSMFGTMMSADPPFLYWKPESLEVIRLCAELRIKGIAAWETMDAGPQVKILTLDTDLPLLRKHLEALSCQPLLMESGPGPGVRRI